MNLTCLAIDNVNVGPHLRNTLAADRNTCREEALVDIYRVMRPGEPPTLEGLTNYSTACSLIKSAMILSSVGRVKMNSRLAMETEDDLRTLAQSGYLVSDEGPCRSERWQRRD